MGNYAIMTGMQTTPETDADLSAILACLVEKPEVNAAYLFGSVARGQARPDSDLDLAVLLRKGLDTESMLEIQLDLLVSLSSKSRGPVQITLLNTAPPYLAYQVIQEGQLLYERDRQERIEFQVSALRTYLDLKPMLDFQNQALLKRLQEGSFGRRKRTPGRTLEAAERIHQRLTRISER